MEAMMWGVVEGLMLAWMSGQRSIDVVSMLTSDAKDGEINLIRKARHYLNEWDVVIQHVYREGNKLVNSLALMAWGQALQSVFYYSPSVTFLDQLDWPLKLPTVTQMLFGRIVINIFNPIG
ncbi:uncharacterized protein LOC105786617 [Gossypium raimondii]|uniref:uncharacterized protein LOC105786617 n=1 Tax=Gossypium raimondii TaxID=29730 RepID=UPI00063A95B7|nr:uncharacterized protein LOC105786617 [Gossypium raimondii]